jgi:AraC-like DNA-binding protein
MPTDQTSPPISTILTPAERRSVDAAGQGLYETLHRDSIDEVVRDVRERCTSAFVVSVSRCAAGEAQRVARLVRNFPRIPAIAILSGTDAASPQALLSLGRSGVRTLVDVRSPDGWRVLRQALAAGWPAEVRRLALDRLESDLAGAPASCFGFFETLFSAETMVSTVCDLAALYNQSSARLAGRFSRLGLPTPRHYLNNARLTRAARLLENPGLSIANVSNRLEYSSPQAFGRHLQRIVHMSASTFRRAYDGERMMERFRQELVLPYLQPLRRLDPG